MGFIRQWLRKRSDFKLLFVTDSLGTKWLDYSQRLIEKEFPHSKRMIVDSPKNWTSLGFLDHLPYDENFDFIIHIDEDCFLFDGDQVRKILQEMYQADHYIAGTPDGGTPYRIHNPYACNLFFLIIRFPILKDLMQLCPDWRALRWDSKYENEKVFEHYKFWHGTRPLDNFEIYYPLYWLGLKEGYSIKYLNVKLNKEYRSSEVYTTHDELPFARHMWYARDWKNHVERYSLNEHDLISRLKF